ncbi:reverse transcriptase/maturase family protein [Nostoc sp. NMS9]|uniref:reverse transcriptase/maturase family protein n=1 Tax=Nostoc sp. NMS9 TaxID=2815393 RepID=UPI0025DD47C7|nr:reverse transcriptase/maturase family protein [Nostoc sp. NMS9]MBN3940004.1 hypothetical protein [Nostoc sp. NMS9]
MLLIEQVTSNEVMDAAYAWLCDRRENYHYNNDVWQLRRWWQEKKPQLVEQLRAGKYRFREQRRVTSQGEVKEIWAALDALVLKAVSIVLQDYLQPHLSTRCFHLAGRGGLKGAVREVADCVSKFEFVFRTDVKGYYASINHEILYKLVADYVQDPVVLDLVGQYLQRFVSDGGEYTDIVQGISLGCPLSPLMGALYLKPLDDRMAELGCFYVRYMDDWVILSPTRWKLRKAIKAVNEVMADLRVGEKHPDKTFIGRISRGFDFLGYWFSPSGLGIAQKTVERCVERISRLYEQGASFERIGEYVRNWWRWVKGGLLGRMIATWVKGLCKNNLNYFHVYA